MGQPHWEKWCCVGCWDIQAGGWSRLRERRRARGLGLQGSGREGQKGEEGVSGIVWLP